jgi:hypothetical protein
MKKLILFSAGAFDWKPTGIYRDEEQLRKKLIEDWGLEGDFDLDEELERNEMKKMWCKDFSTEK